MDIQLGTQPFAVIVAAATAQMVVTVRGDVDVFTAPVLREALKRAEGQRLLGGRPLVVDVSGVTFLDATGLGVLAGTAHRVHRRGGEIVLRHPSRMTMRVLEITGLLSVFRIEQTADLGRLPVATRDVA